MPQDFYDVASRVDHVLSALLPGTIEKLNIAQNVDLSVKLPVNPNDATNVKLNNISTSVPLSYEFNYGNIDQMSVDYGITSICNIYKNNLNTFVQKTLQLDDSLRSKFSLNNETLLVGECSDKPRLAIFIGYENNTDAFSYIKVYTAGHFVTIRADGEPIITFNGEQHNLRESAFEYPQFQSDFK